MNELFKEQRTMNKTVYIGARSYNLYDIAKMTDMSIEELAYCTREELIDIVLDWLNG